MMIDLRTPWIGRLRKHCHSICRGATPREPEQSGQALILSKSRVSEQATNGLLFARLVGLTGQKPGNNPDPMTRLPVMQVPGGIIGDLCQRAATAGPASAVPQRPRGEP